MRRTVETSDGVKLSSCLGDFLCGGEGDGLVVVLAGDKAVVEAAEQAVEQVALGGGMPVAGVFAAVVVGAGAGGGGPRGERPDVTGRPEPGVLYAPGRDGPGLFAGAGGGGGARLGP